MTGAPLVDQRIVETMHVKSGNPLVPQCNLSALTNSQRHHGTLLDARGECVINVGINELVYDPRCGLE